MAVAEKISARKSENLTKTELRNTGLPVPLHLNARNHQERIVSSWSQDNGSPRPARVSELRALKPAPGLFLDKSFLTETVSKCKWPAEWNSVWPTQCALPSPRMNDRRRMFVLEFIDNNG
ncbi:hypothetical protein CBL_07995 [Carabus blaptoides fortunei]